MPGQRKANKPAVGSAFFDSPLFNEPSAAILRAAQEAIVMIDEAQTIVAFNPAAQAMFGCPPEQALGQPIARFVPLTHRARHEEHVRRFAASNEVQRRIAPGRRISALHADGTEFPVEITLSRVDTIVDGRTRHWFAALLRDMTTEQALRDEIDIMTRRLHAALDGTPVAMWIAQEERVEYANRAAALLFGEAAAQALHGRTLASLLPASTLADLREELARGGGGPAARVAGQLRRVDGTLRDIEIVLAPLPDHGHAVVQMVIDDVTEHRRAAAELERTGQALRRLQASVVEAREEERRRIARELHDELGQRLTALKMELAALRGAAAAARDAQIENMLGMVDETLASVRRISTDLRPMMLDDLGLHAALEWLARDAARRLGIEVTLQLDEHEPVLDDRVATAAFRMVQEALTNVARHARASDVQIGLHRAGGALQISVRDNGVGYPDDALRREGSMGLIGMRERAALLGGHAELSNPPGGGALLRVQLPLAPEDKENRA